MRRTHRKKTARKCEECKQPRFRFVLESKVHFISIRISVMVVDKHVPSRACATLPTSYLFFGSCSDNNSSREYQSFTWIDNVPDVRSTDLGSAQSYSSHTGEWRISAGRRCISVAALQRELWLLSLSVPRTNPTAWCGRVGWFHFPRWGAVGNPVERKYPNISDIPADERIRICRLPVGRCDRKTRHTKWDGRVPTISERNLFDKLNPFWCPKASIDWRDWTIDEWIEVFARELPSRTSHRCWRFWIRILIFARRIFGARQCHNYSCCRWFGKRFLWRQKPCFVSIQEIRETDLSRPLIDMKKENNKCVARAVVLATLTLENNFVLFVLISEQVIFAKKDIPLRTKFGPFEGDVRLFDDDMLLAYRATHRNLPLLFVNVNSILDVSNESEF